MDSITLSSGKNINLTYKKHDYTSPLKMCSKCKKEYKRSTEYFYKDSKSRDGLQYLCKPCKALADKESRKDNLNYIKYQKSPNFVFSQLKYQAKKRNMPFELTFDYYIENLAHKPCYYCGSKKTKHWVDRYLNNHNIGYTIKNTVPCCETCNKMKISLSPDIFINHCKKISNHNI